MSDPVWPSGYGAFYKKLAECKDTILTGTVLAIDPSSGGTSVPGYAIYRAGVYVTSGVVSFPKPKRSVDLRVQHLYDQVNQLLGTPPDVLVIEEVHPRMSSYELQWAIGASVAAARAPITFQIPINVWRALAKADPSYEKGDEADARLMGLAMILLARR